MTNVQQPCNFLLHFKRVRANLTDRSVQCLILQFYNYSKPYSKFYNLYQIFIMFVNIIK